MRRGNELLGNVDHVLADLHVIARIAADSRSIRRIELPGPSRAASPFRLSRQADPHPNAANLFVYRASVIVIVARAGENFALSRVMRTLKTGMGFGILVWKQWLSPAAAVPDRAGISANSALIGYWRIIPPECFSFKLSMCGPYVRIT